MAPHANVARPAPDPGRQLFALVFVTLLLAATPAVATLRLFSLLSSPSRAVAAGHSLQSFATSNGAQLSSIAIVNSALTPGGLVLDLRYRYPQPTLGCEPREFSLNTDTNSSTFAVVRDSGYC